MRASPHSVKKVSLNVTSAWVYTVERARSVWFMTWKVHFHQQSRKVYDDVKHMIAIVSFSLSSCFLIFCLFWTKHLCIIVLCVESDWKIASQLHYRIQIVNMVKTNPNFYCILWSYVTFITINLPHSLLKFNVGKVEEKTKSLIFEHFRGKLLASVWVSAGSI